MYTLVAAAAAAATQYGNGTVRVQKNPGSLKKPNPLVLGVLLGFLWLY